YANRPLPEIRSRHHLGRILPGERACAVVPAVAYPRLPPPLRALPSEKWHIGGLRLKLVSGTTGSCPPSPTVTARPETVAIVVHAPPASGGRQVTDSEMPGGRFELPRRFRVGGF